MRLLELVSVSEQVGRAGGRLEKVEHLAGLLRRLLPEEVEIAVSFLSGSPRQGRLGIGPAAITQARAEPPSPTPQLGLREADDALSQLAACTGSGATAEKARQLRALLGRATAPEQDFLVRLLYGELRQGALEGVLTEAVARAAGLPGEDVRRAAMQAGALGAVALAALTRGAAGLSAFGVRLFQPVQPMLAGPAPGTDEALEALGEAALEYKLDGARIQVHRGGGEVRVYSRALREVTAAVPEVVEAVQALPGGDLILDGEVIALRPDGTPLPFQDTMRRFGRKLDVDTLRRELPLTPFFFDAIYHDGADLTGEPLSQRSAVLAAALPPPLLVPRLITGRRDEAAAFLAQATAAGHEGIMAKAPGAGYAAGSRGQAWLKIKPAHTLDLVVLAAEWGHGRRTGWLSNLHLGARGESGFVMLGKTFKGLTDEMLAWQTERLQALEIGRDAYTVYVRPELVVEVAFNDVQESPQYPGGLALRFARVKAYRPEKRADEADTLAAVQEIYRRATGREPPQR